MRRWRHVVAAASGAVLLATRATAQTPSAAPDWTLTFGTLATSDNNVRFAEQGESDLSQAFRARVAREWSLPRGALGLSGDGTQTLYRTASDLDHLSYGLTVHGTYQLTHRATIRVDDAFTSALSRDAPVLGAEGLFFPLAQTQINTAGGSYAYSLSRRSELQVELRNERVSFDSPELRDGSTFTSRASFRTQVDRREIVGFTQEYQYVATEGGDTAVVGLLGTWQRTLGTALNVSAAGGAQAYGLTGPAKIRLTPTGSVRLRGRFRGATTIVTRYQRLIDQAFGFGRVGIADHFAASYGLTLSRRLGFELGTEYNRSVDPAAPAFRLTGRGDTAILRCVVAGGLTVVATGSRSERADASTPTVTGVRVSVSVLYDRSSR
jgi:hypothetical protein